MPRASPPAAGWRQLDVVQQRSAFVTRGSSADGKWNMHCFFLQHLKVGWGTKSNTVVDVFWCAQPPVGSFPGSFRVWQRGVDTIGTRVATVWTRRVVAGLPFQRRSLVWGDNIERQKYHSPLKSCTFKYTPNERSKLEKWWFHENVHVHQSDQTWH